MMILWSVKIVLEVQAHLAQAENVVQDGGERLCCVHALYCHPVIMMIILHIPEAQQ